MLYKFVSSGSQAKELNPSETTLIVSLAETTKTVFESSIPSRPVDFGWEPFVVGEGACPGDADA